MKFNKFALSELATIKYGKNQKKVLSESGNVPIYGTGGLMGYATTSLYDKPSVLIGRKGTIGKVKYVEHPFWTVDTLFYTIVNTDIVLPKYLYYVMSLIDLNNYNEGTTIPSLRTETLNRLEFDIPSLVEQETILSCLNPIDEKIALNNAINNNLEQQAALLFDKNYSNNNYNISTLEAVATIKYGKGLPTKKLTAQGFPVFGGNGVIGRYTHFMYEEPQVLVSCRGAASGKIMESYPNSFVTNNSLILEWNDYRYYEFYKQFLLANPLNSYATGSAQPQITIDNIKNVPIPYPNYDEISELCLTLKSISSLHYENVMENNKLANLRDTLLPHLMSGELDVSDIDL